MNNCRNCGKNIHKYRYFCNLECEEEYRKNHQEVYILLKNGVTENICPVIDLTENDELISINNGWGIHTFYKKDIKKWKIDGCSCFQEFMKFPTDLNSE